jgi:protease II
MSENIKGRTFDSAEDVELYYKLVYYLVGLSKYVAKQDKLDVAHDAILLLSSKPRTINVRYISITTRRAIYRHVQKGMRDIDTKLNAKAILYGGEAENDFSEFDWNELPLSTEERSQLERLLSHDEDQAIADEDGVGLSAVWMRRKRLLSKIRKRLAEKYELDYNEDMSNGGQHVI